jgi:hypothetical protein
VGHRAHHIGSARWSESGGHGGPPYIAKASFLIKLAAFLAGGWAETIKNEIKI